MLITRNTCLTAALCLAIAPLAAADGPAALETDGLRLEIGVDGTLRSLASKPDSTECARTAEPAPVAVVYRGGRSVPGSEGKYASTGRWVYRGGRAFPAAWAKLDGDELEIGFGPAGVTATYRLIARSRYLAFELVDLAGAPIDRIDFLRLDLKGLPQRGPWVNAASDDRFAVCLLAGNVATNAQMDEHADHAVLRATAEKEVGFEGATAVLFGCRYPRALFLDAMAVVERDFDMPSGALRRRAPEQRFSYLWASRPTPENVDEYVRWAKRGGFRMVLFSYTAFSTGAGHFAWNDSYPNGMADLKRVTRAIRKAGLRVGLHIHYSKAHKSDAYVTPVPDDRLHQVRRFTLAADVDAEAGTIPVDESPAGCTRDDGRRILKLGTELIAYQDFSTKRPFRFTGCERGHLGTAAADHRRGDRVGLLDVDTWPAFIRYDQETDLQDETARRIGEIYRATGPYHMIYFDGAEDVHAPFWHHVAAAQLRVYRHLKPPPPVCEAPHYTNFSWHVITRSNAYDVVAPADGMKDFCRLMPCRTAAARMKDFSRIDFGWLGRFGGGPSRCAGPDVWEYVASRAAAWDCPLSLKVSLDEIASNPRRDDCFDVLRAWEDARLGNVLTDEQRAMLRNVPPEHARYVPCYEQRETWNRIRTGRNLTGAQRRILADRREHHLLVDERGRYELVPIVEIAGVAGGAVKAYRFERAERTNATYVLLWAVGDRLTLRLPVPPDRLTAMRPFGKRLSVGASERGAQAAVEIGGRTYLVLPGVEGEEAARLIGRAAVVGAESRGS